ncbi:MAG: hypothetical protein WCG87_06765 [Bacteroidota bacterium]
MISTAKTYALRICGILLFCLYAGHSFAQSTSSQSSQPQTLQFAQPHPPAKLSQRYEIDAKRMGVALNSDDALPRSREFKRVDSTYYVGWMFEGAYKYFHSADYLGYKNASIPLERALALAERDYKKQLGTRTPNLIDYYPAYKFQIDYTQIALFLMNCYNNTEQPEKTYALLKRVLKWNFQREFYMDAYNYLAWTVHRNRFYTSAKYPFLKNSIDENEALANHYLDLGLKKIEKDMIINAHVFQPGYELIDKLAVYHYKSIIYSYALKIDSAAYYYNLLRKAPSFPHNNFATFRSVCGDFRQAESEYKKASDQDASDKRLQEWAYYSSILDIYKSLPKDGTDLMHDMIKAAGSTPGFGWYNIALARCLLYDGQNEEAKHYINKASEFKELHIGTTLGQSHYDFSIQLIKLLNKQNEWQAQQFENRNWWYNPTVLGHMAQLLTERYTQQFLIINQFAHNPERDRVIYKLFSTESTVSWDEIWYLIRDFSTGFFLDRFQKAANTDDRRYIHKYFQYFVARLKMKQGHYHEAQTILNTILHDTNIDAEYEQLFLARTYQAQAECAQHTGDKTAYTTWISRLYSTYPQLIPYSGLLMPISLHISGQVDNEVVDRLKACNIDWVTSPNVPQAYISFTRSGTRRSITCSVRDAAGKDIVPPGSFAWQNPQETGTTLAYRLFNIGTKSPEQIKEQASITPKKAH